MPVTTASAAVHITPVVFKTFFEHGKKKAKKIKDGRKDEEATDDIFFDEAFHIVKSFIDMGTRNTVESLQGFTNTHVPAPYWAAVSPVCIPLSTCNRAADGMIDWFGPEELKQVVGGERWWQVRGLNGVDGEWITEKSYLSEEDVDVGRKLSHEDENIIRMEKLETVMLYVHGGGYFWGSINTHRYQIIRYARKFKGRAFAVNYRKAPQYPWPCPLQDVLAAYFYLIEPPPDALHKAIPPSKIVFAGDSAGAGLALAVLTVLRDMEMPMPAGAVLISPWVDLTHSFPSVMNNAATDIIPPHGFLAKPSASWPVDPLPKDKEGRVVPTTTNPPPKPGHADTLKPSKERLDELDNKKQAGEPQEKVKTQEEMLEAGANGDGEDAPKPRHADTLMPSDARLASEGGSGPTQEAGTPQTSSTEGSSSSTSSGADKPKTDPDYDIDVWEPNPPKVLMKDPKAIPLELRSQIQLYATMEQLTHPLVSPVLQGSLGNLPPLYIICGDDEVLRDEILYIAHRAAHPEKYPVRKGVLREGTRQRENKEKFKTPTKVHLQAFDDMCHVLTVFIFTSSAKYAYRSIAEFTKHVTQNSAEHLERNPFPELHRPSSHISADSDEHHRGKKSKAKTTSPGRLEAKALLNSENSYTKTEASDIRMYKVNEDVAAREIHDNIAELMPGSESVSVYSVDDGEHDIPNVMMLRERIDIHGHARPMEPEDQISALQIRSSEIGLIKEAPTMRWLEGQEEWDKKYRRSALAAIKQRKKLEVKSKQILAHARAQGLLLVGDTEPQVADVRQSRQTDRAIQPDRRWGPLDLENERPPPTAIAKRRDTPEALALLRKSIYFTAPVTHLTVPKMKTSDAIRAAFDMNDDPINPPKQSVSEQQVRTHIIPFHGLRIWDTIVGYFMRKSSERVVNGKDHTVSAVKIAGNHLGVRSETKDGEE